MNLKQSVTETLFAPPPSSDINYQNIQGDFFLSRTFFFPSESLQQTCFDAFTLCSRRRPLKVCDLVPDVQRKRQPPHFSTKDSKG